MRIKAIGCMQWLNGRCHHGAILLFWIIKRRGALRHCFERFDKPRFNGHWNGHSIAYKMKWFLSISIKPTMRCKKCIFHRLHPNPPFFLLRTPNPRYPANTQLVCTYHLIWDITSVPSPFQNPCYTFRWRSNEMKIIRLCANVCWYILPVIWSAYPDNLHSSSMY